MDSLSCFLEVKYAREPYESMLPDAMPGFARNWNIHHCKIVTHRLDNVRHFFTNKFLFNATHVSTNNSSIVLQKGTVRFILESISCPEGTDFIEAVTDIAIQVDSVDDQVQCMVRNGATLLEPPHDINDEHGHIRVAVVSSVINSLVHTLIQRDDYRSFLPNFDEVFTELPNDFIHLDHIAIVTNRGETDSVLRWFENCFGMQRFRVNASEDESEGFIVRHGNSGMRLKALNYWRCMETGVRKSTKHEDEVKFVIVEPLSFAGPNQVTRFLQQNEGPGVQHIAFLTNDIINVARDLKASGLQFMTPPSTYYEAVGAYRISDTSVNELLDSIDLDAIRDASVLIDVEEQSSSDDKQKVLMQIFTKAIFERDTLFMELIQRNGSEGFGAANIKALWVAVERYMDLNPK